MKQRNYLSGEISDISGASARMREIKFIGLMLIMKNRDLSEYTPTIICILTIRLRVGLLTENAL